MIVSRCVAVMRSVERIELPSTRQLMIWVRRASGRRFIGFPLFDACNNNACRILVQALSLKNHIRRAAMAEEKNPDRVKAGKARAKALSPQQRTHIARRAAIMRWAEEGKPPPILAKYGAADRPLKIGDIEIACYVLTDGTRVLSQRGLQGGVGLSLSGGPAGVRRIALLMAMLAPKGIDFRGLIARTNSPIRFL